MSRDLSSRDEVVAVEDFVVEDVTKDGVEENLSSRRLSTGSLSTIRFIVEDETCQHVGNEYEIVVDDFLERSTRARIECDPCRVRLLGRCIGGGLLT